MALGSADRFPLLLALPVLVGRGALLGRFGGLVNVLGRLFAALLDLLGDLLAAFLDLLGGLAGDSRDALCGLVRSLGSLFGDGLDLVGGLIDDLVDRPHPGLERVRDADDADGQHQVAQDAAPTSPALCAFFDALPGAFRLDLVAPEPVADRDAGADEQQRPGQPAAPRPRRAFLLGLLHRFLERLFQRLAHGAFD